MGIRGLRRWDEGGAPVVRRLIPLTTSHLSLGACGERGEVYGMGSSERSFCVVSLFELSASEELG